MDKQLVEIIEVSQLPQTKTELILNQFKGFFEQAKKFESKAKSIVVKNIDQIAEMNEAREIRLQIKEIRINTERVRKELKEQSKREGQAIDGIANVIKALVVPIEEYLESQEKFAENLEKERIEKLYEDRLNEISKYTDDVDLYNFRELDGDQFNKLLSVLKKTHEEKLSAEKKVEEERIKAEKEKEAEQQRIRIENEKLKKEAEAKEKELAKEREAKEKELAEERKKAEAERKKFEQQQQKEREAKEKLEAELKAKKDAEEAEAEKKAEAERKAKLAPDKDKLIAYAKAIDSIDIPEVESEEAKQALNKAIKLINQAQLILKIK